MSKRRRKNSNQKTKSVPSRAVSKKTSLIVPSEETQVAEAMTVFWMIAALAAVSSQGLGVVLQLIMRQQMKSEAWLVVASRTLLLVAFIAGLFTLLLTPLVLRIRTVSPPRPIVIGAILAGAMSLVTAFW